MTSKAVILKNAFSMLTVRILTPLSALLLFIAASRMYAVAEIGKYSLLLAFYQIAQYLPLLGLNPYIVKEVSRNRSLAGKYIVNMSLLGFAASLLVSGGLYVLGIFLGYPADVLQGMLWLCLLVITGTLAVIYESIFIAYEKMDIIAWVVVIESALRLGVSVWLMSRGYGFMYLIAVMAVSRLGAMGVYMLIMKKSSEHKTEPSRADFNFIKELLVICRIFFAISLCSTLINRVDFVLLSKLKTFEEVGYYTASYRMLDLCVLLASTLIFSTFPTLSRLYHSSANQAHAATEALIKYLFILMALLVAFIFSFAAPIITLFYTKSYLASVGVLRILVLAALFMSLDQILSSLFIISGRQRLDLKVLFFGTLIYLVFLTALIPPFGFYGAGIATVAAMALQLGIRYFYFRKELFSLPLLRLLWRPFLAGFLFIVFAGTFKSYFWLYIAPLAVVVYILALYALGALGKKDMDAFYRLKPAAGGAK